MYIFLRFVEIFKIYFLYDFFLEIHLEAVTVNCH